MWVLQGWEQINHSTPIQSTHRWFTWGIYMVSGKIHVSVLILKALWFVWRGPNGAGGSENLMGWSDDADYSPRLRVLTGSPDCRVTQAGAGLLPAERGWRGVWWHLPQNPSWLISCSNLWVRTSQGRKSALSAVIWALSLMQGKSSGSRGGSREARSPHAGQSLGGENDCTMKMRKEEKGRHEKDTSSHQDGKREGRDCIFPLKEIVCKGRCVTTGVLLDPWLGWCHSYHLLAGGLGEL